MVEQHVGFALDAAGHCCVLASGRVTAEGRGGNDSVTDVRSAMAIRGPNQVLAPIRRPT